FTEALIRNVAIQTTGSAVLTYQDRTLDLSKPFKRLTIVQAIQENAPHYTTEQLSDVDFLKAELTRLGVDVNDPAHTNAGVGAWQLALFEEVAEAKLWD